MDSILIIGAGFVGSNLAMLAQNNFDVQLTCRSSSINSKIPGKISKLDITDYHQTYDLIKKIAPKVIINTAAISSPHACAKDKQLCQTINTTGPENIAIAARDSSARLIHISTDLVYNGSGSYYKETDPTEHSCFYGKTKLDSERAVAENCSNYCILRSALVFGQNVTRQKRFTDTLIEKLKDNQPVELFSNEYRSMIHVNDLCSIILDMANMPDFNGILNAGGPERISRYEFGIKVAETFGLDTSLVKPALVNQELFNDHRPEDCSMNIDKLQRLIGRKPITVSQGLELMKTTA